MPWVNGRLNNWLNGYNEMFSKFTLNYMIDMSKGSNKDEPRDPCKGLDDGRGRGLMTAEAGAWGRRV